MNNSRMDYYTKRVCLLMTGCINPSDDVGMLAINSSEKRRDQTIKAISFFIDHTDIKKIVYCDNSGTHEDEELYYRAQEKGKEFEWLSFLGDVEKTLQKGKGYGEGEIIKYAMEYSRLISESSIIIKCTGRLYVRNTNLMLKLLNKNYSYLDYHDGYIDTRFYVVQKDDYENYLIDAHNSVDDYKKKYIENVFFHIAYKSGDVFKPFLLSPDIVGVSGSMGRIYNDSFLIHYAKTIRTALRAIKWHLRRKESQ